MAHFLKVKHLNWLINKSQSPILGCGCGTVGSAVASETRGPGFESSHWQLLLNNYC